MPEAAIGLMARYPRLGQVKTRLARSIGAEAALRVYKSLLAQSCELVASLKSADFCRTAFVTPEEDRAMFESEYPGFDSYCQQQGADLGKRMMKALEKMGAISGAGKLLLIGADCPQLDDGLICEASRLLSHDDLVFGPSTDGGYYLIGAKKVYPELFSGINWGTSSVMTETFTAAKSLGLSIALLPELRDLDDEHDFSYFERAGLI